MRIEYINPFVDAANDIISEVLGTIKKGELYLKETSQPILGVAVLVGIAGDVRGRLLLDMNRDTAIKVSDYMNGEKTGNFDQMAKSTITELANMIAGLAITKLSNLGFTFHVSPPTILTGDNMEITSTQIEAIIVPMETDFGLIELNVAIKENQP